MNYNYAKIQSVTHGNNPTVIYLLVHTVPWIHASSLKPEGFWLIYALASSQTDNTTLSKSWRKQELLLVNLTVMSTTDMKKLKYTYTEHQQFESKWQISLLWGS